MKKIVIGVIITAMFAWAIYDFAGNNDETNTSETNVEEQGGAAITSKPSGEAEPATPNEKGDPEEVGLQTGNIAPDFELTTLNGETVKLSDYRGKRVMLNFWASWCPPCRAEMPDMEKFHQNTDVQILAVDLTTTEANESDVTNFVEDFGLTFPILMDREGKVMTQYQIRPIPSTFMIDSNGRIQYKAFGAMNYELMIQQYEKME